ncbi:unnamed protein product [Bursaphelenchus xylophilus]|nr:unnamed protein product [Bursaphelenchus xylophilus]CAG9081347.1 unnamed protein product [Bursaphelenchus xylophilus]
MSAPEPGSTLPEGNIPSFYLQSLLPPHATASPASKSDLKPPYSYIGLISMAILSNPERKMLLSQIYNWIAMEYPYFR